MRLTTAVFLIFSFLAVAVFSFAAVNHDNHSGCIAAAFKGVSCPPEADALSFLNFHLDALKKFSTAVFGERFLTAILIFAVLLLIGSKAAFGGNLFFPPLGAISFPFQVRESFTSPFKISLTHWLAFHENSPTFSH